MCSLKLKSMNLTHFCLRNKTILHYIKSIIECCKSLFFFQKNSFNVTYTGTVDDETMPFNVVQQGFLSENITKTHDSGKPIAARPSPSKSTSHTPVRSKIKIWYIFLIFFIISFNFQFIFLTEMFCSLYSARFIFIRKASQINASSVNLHQTALIWFSLILFSYMPHASPSTTSKNIQDIVWTEQ